MNDINEEIITTEEEDAQEPKDAPEDVEASEQENRILQMVRERAKKMGKVYDLDGDDDESSDDTGDKPRSSLIRVASDSPVERLAYHMVNMIKQDGVAICQAIGPAANQKVDLAVVAALSIISRYQPTATLVVLPCIRKPTMDNGEERTAIRKRIFPINSNLVI